MDPTNEQLEMQIELLEKELKDNAVETMDTSESTPPVAGTEQTQPGETETPGGKKDSKETPKKVYTEEERLKRKAYFKQLRERRRAARGGFRPGVKRPLDNSRQKDIQDNFIISFDMTEEEDKVLEFYKVKLSALKSTNEQLHKRLAYLVKENLRLLQMPPLNKA